jgi:hypothetical protein
MAGPERPPVTLVRIGLRKSTSTAIPFRVLTAVIASAPPLSAALAISAMSVTLGESLTKTGGFETSFTAVVTFSVFRQSAPSIPISSSTLGQLTLTSSASAPASERIAATSLNSSMEAPKKLATTGIPSSFRAFIAFT